MHKCKYRCKMLIILANFKLADSIMSPLAVMVGGMVCVGPVLLDVNTLFTCCTL